MTVHAFGDESFEVLVFVCVPLLLTLIAVLVLGVRLNPRKAITLPTFSLTLSTAGHGEAFVIYSDECKKLYFDAEIGRGTFFRCPRIYLRVPKKMPPEDVGDIVPKLALALGKLRYPYVIYRPSELQVTPQQVREAAITRLHQMGAEIDVSQDQVRIRKTAIKYWRRVLGMHSSTTMAQWLRLVGEARGVRENIEILARSD